MLVATHDAEFAAAWAERTILLGDGRPVADAPTTEVLGGGWYFSTQTARVLGGARRRARPGGRRRAAARAGGGGHVSWVARLVRAARGRARRRVRLVRARAPDRARDRAGGDARRARRARPDRLRAAPERQADDRHRADRRLRARRRARLRRSARWRRWRRTCSSARDRGRRGRWPPGAASALAGAALARVAGRELGRVPLAAACAVASLGFGAVMNLHLWVTVLGRPHARRSSARTSRRRCRSTSRTRSAARCSASRSARRWCARSRATGRASRSAGCPRRRADAAGRAARRGRRARPPPRGRRTRTPPRPAPRSATCWTPRTTTAAGAARPASPPRSCTRHGRRSGWPPPAATRATSGRPSAVAYIRAHPGQLNVLGDVSRTMLVLGAAGVKPRVGGRDLERELLDAQRAQRLVRGPREHDRVRDPRPARGRPPRPRAGSAMRAANFIAGQANPDGGFNFAGRGGPSGIDDTGAALQALARRRPRARHGGQARGPLHRPPPGVRRRLRADPRRARRTRSPRPGRSRACSPPGATRRRCAATARATR